MKAPTTESIDVIKRKNPLPGEGISSTAFPSFISCNVCEGLSGKMGMKILSINQIYKI